MSEWLRRYALPVLLALSTTAAVQRLPLEKIKLPPGFEMSVFAEGWLQGQAAWGDARSTC
jgi:hypothetical protein